MLRLSTQMIERNLIEFNVRQRLLKLKITCQAYLLLNCFIVLHVESMNCDAWAFPRRLPCNYMQNCFVEKWKFLSLPLLKRFDEWGFRLLVLSDEQFQRFHRNYGRKKIKISSTIIKLKTHLMLTLIHCLFKSLNCSQRNIARTITKLQLFTTQIGDSFTWCTRVGQAINPKENQKKLINWRTNREKILFLIALHDLQDFFTFSQLVQIATIN